MGALESLGAPSPPLGPLGMPVVTAAAGCGGALPPLSGPLAFSLALSLRYPSVPTPWARHKRQRHQALLLGRPMVTR